MREALGHTSTLMSVSVNACPEVRANAAQNEYFKQHLQPEIMYTMLKEGIVNPQNQRVVEGATLLERAQKALDMLRRKEASMERLVWRVRDE
jgi:hypothetical protein